MVPVESSKTWIEVILRPIVRFFLRRGVVFQEFDRAARKLFVQLAREELQKSTTKINISRISVLTGLQRPEVQRFLVEAPKLPVQSSSLIARVLSRWETNKKFRTKDGSPRTLKHEGEKSEFTELCAGVSTAINPGTLLFEMQRIGLVKVTSHGIKMIKAVEGSLHDSEKAQGLVGRDIETVLLAADENISRLNKQPNHHTRTEYDNIRVDKVSEVREWLINEGGKFHRHIREYLAQFDLDINPDPDASVIGGAKVTITSVSHSVSPLPNALVGNMKSAHESN